MHKITFALIALSVGIAGPAFASNGRDSGINIDIAAAASHPAPLSKNPVPDRAHSDFVMHAKLSQYELHQDCLKRVNLLTGRNHTDCTIVHN